MFLSTTPARALAAIGAAATVKRPSRLVGHNASPFLSGRNGMRSL
jgi:hypothetical protein